MQLKNHKYLWYGAILVFMIDQLTKLLALTYLKFDHEIPVNTYLSLHLIFNPDTIMLDYQLPFGLSVEAFRLVWVAQAAILAFSIYWVTSKEPLKSGGWVAEFAKVGLFLILGSIWGNAYDRIFRSEGVVDFIRLNLFADSTPIMNIADIMLYVGEINLLCAWVILILMSIKNSLKNIKTIKAS